MKWAGALALLLVGAAPASAQITVPPIGGGGSGAPPPPVVAPAAPGTEAVATEGLDAAHTNWSGDSSLRPPFGVLWKAKLPFAPDKVITSGGRVFVEARALGSQVDLVALDGGTGKRLWTLELHGSGDLAFAGGVLVVAADGRLRGVNPASGAVVWDRPEPAIRTITPVGTEVAFRSGGDAHHPPNTKLVDAASGATRWDVADDSEDPRIPPIVRGAAAGDRIYFGGDCDAAAYDRRNGNRIWFSYLGCAGSSPDAVTRLTDTRVAISQKGGFQGRWLHAGDGKDAARLPAANIVADGVGVTLGPFHAFRLSDGAALWDHTIDTGSHAVAVGDQVLFGDDGDLVVLGLHDGARRWVARAQGDGAFVGTIWPGGGLLLVQVKGGLLALAPQSRTGGPPVKLKTPRRAHVFGDPYRVRGVAGGELTRRTAVRVTADPYPYGRGPRHASTVNTNMDGRFSVRRTPQRATLYSFSAEGGKPKSWIGLVMPRYRPHFTHPTPTTVLLRVSVRLPRSVPARGRVIGLYLGRRHAKRFVRLAATHLRGRRGSFSAVMRFRAVEHVGRRDFISLCIARIWRSGIGFGDRLDRRCGAGSVRF